jgi:uncharacterized protein (DUF3084 family)
MLRNRNRNGYGPSNNFAPYNQPPTPPQSPVSQLDAKDERLVDLSEIVGQLGAQNDLLNEDNRRLEQENESLGRRNKELQERNTELERRDATDAAAFESVDNFINDVKTALKEKK